MSAETENVLVEEKKIMDESAAAVATAADGADDNKKKTESLESKSNSETDSADESVVIEAKLKPRTPPKKPRAAMPTGNYALVSVDVDTTGRRLIDEVAIYNHKK